MILHAQGSPLSVPPFVSSPDHQGPAFGVARAVMYGGLADLCATVIGAGAGGVFSA